MYIRTILSPGVFKAGLEKPNPLGFVNKTCVLLRFLRKTRVVWVFRRNKSI